MRLLAVILSLLAGLAHAQDAPLTTAGPDCAFHRSEGAARLATDDALKARGTSLALAREAGTVTVHGDWFQLESPLCEITLPAIDSPLTLDEALPFFARVEGDGVTLPGCYLDLGALRSYVEQSREDDPDAIARVIFALTGQGLVDGTLAYFVEDRRAVPMGVQLVTGDCAELPQIDRIRADDAILHDHFGAFVRAYGRAMPCDDRFWPDMLAIGADVTAGKTTNHMIGAEMIMIAQAAGWIEDAGATGRGRPRPPMCHGSS